MAAAFGVGLRAPHHLHLQQCPPERWGVDLLEVTTENLLDDQGAYQALVQALARRRPISLHGVSLSIGGLDPLDLSYLERLRGLAEHLEAPAVSDHLCWTRLGGWQSHELLPMPLTEESLRWVCLRVQEVQARLGRRVLLENPSRYLDFALSTMGEGPFLRRLCEETGCGLLLDVNNLWVTGWNLGFDPLEALGTYPLSAVAQLHLAGPRRQGALWVDTHDQPVREEVWALYREAARRCPLADTLIEWDADIPPWERLLAELDHARTVAREARA
jgi:uncharacterized protein (UPF0276 family)